MNGKPSSLSFTSWLQRFWQDLQPTPGRLNSSLRMTLATVLTLVLLLVLQMPFAAFGLYAVFLTVRESPSASLRLGLAILVTVTLAIAIELAVVYVTDNDPMARVLSASAIAFLGGMIVVGTSLPALGSSWGLIYITVIAFWENHSPADTLVKNSLRLLAAFSIAIACAVAVEYVFGVRSPADRLKEQFRLRYLALEKMFSLYARDAEPKRRFEAASQVSRLAASGQAGMTDLYNQIADRDFDMGVLPIAARVHITILAKLMDDSAAFGLQSQVQEDSTFRQRCERIAEQCRSLMRGLVPHSERRFEAVATARHSLLDHVEGDIRSILLMPTGPSGAKNKELVGVPSKKVPLFIPGAIADLSNIGFSLKISLCATICYILYRAIDYPGISTSAITVMVAGLTTTGAIKQRLTLRLLGATIGGLILGLGTITFLFPSMDSITSLVVLVGSVAFVCGWISGGARFNYVGLQVAFAFYLVTLQGFGASTELEPARDRLIGILVALVVMWFVFDQIWPVRTVTAMRRLLASVLRSAASLLQLIDATREHDELLRNTESLRDRVGKNIATLRTLSEAVEYEFGLDREQHVRSSEVILRIAVTAAALIWNQLALLHDEHDMHLITEPGLVEMRRTLAEYMNTMAESIVQETVIYAVPIVSSVSASLLKSERYGEYTQNTIALCEDLQALALALGRDM